MAKPSIFVTKPRVLCQMMLGHAKPGNAKACGVQAWRIPSYETRHRARTLFANVQFTSLVQIIYQLSLLDCDRRAYHRPKARDVIAVPRMPAHPACSDGCT
jgi:hypothetical protein